MASELFFYATINTFDEIITEFRSCCDGSTEMERELLQQTAITNNLLTKWKSHPGPYKWNYCPPDVPDDMLMKIELRTYLAMKMHLDGSNPRERALVARLTKMEDDFGKAMDAQEKKPSQDSQNQSRLEAPPRIVVVATSLPARMGRMIAQRFGRSEGSATNFSPTDVGVGYLYRLITR